MPVENRTGYAILGWLSVMPMSGYDIKKSIDNSIAHFWNENYGHLYPVLARLHKEGLIQPVPSPQGKKPKGRTSRKAYVATPAGKEKLLSWLRQPPAPPYLRIELLLKLFFGSYVNPEISLKAIELERKTCLVNLEEFSKIENIVNCEDMPEHRPYSLMCLEYGKSYYSSILGWCDKAEKTLKELNKKKGSNLK